ncbi:MAG: FAD-dependent oxidoreductase [Acidobacteriota bacterium]
MGMKTVILGAGLTGLSCAFHMGDDEYAVFEAGDRPGGLCRSENMKGFAFDYTGHLLHLRDPYVTELVLQRLLPRTFRRHPRRAYIHSFGKWTPYPFQANMYGLPRDVVRECLVGFVRAAPRRGAGSFEAWALGTFGEGIYKHFLRPYNEKLWLVPLDRLTHEWCSWSVPKPTLEEIVDGAIGNPNRSMGYNPTFYYPREGGIETLPRAFARRAHAIQAGFRAVRVDVRRRRVSFANGYEAAYDRLISTVPLDELLSMTRNGPAEWHSVAARLKRVPILALRLGIRGPALLRKHWIYFPEARFPFYRVGVASNFESSLAPPGCSNLYVEVSLPSPHADPAPIVEECMARLRDIGIEGETIVRETTVIPCAYVLYDDFRKKAVPRVLADLARHGIMSTGRYGGWKYSHMEGAILDGRKAARWARG